MKEKFQDRKFKLDSLALIERSNGIIAEYMADGYMLTLRQLYYQLVSRDVIPNEQREYNRLGGIINDARLAGLVDWDAIEDRTRNLQSLSHWSTPDELVDLAATQYRIDKWSRENGQKYRPEVWVEKDALIGVLERACNELDVPYFSCRGYTSQSELYGASKRMLWAIENHQTPCVIHLGDHDPSGKDMTRDSTAISLAGASDLPTGIDAAKIADGSVSNAEFQRLDGVTSGIQAQFDLKAPLASPTFTGTVVIPTPFTLGAVSVTSTGTQINYLNAATGTTGTASSNVVFSASPTIVTPTIASFTNATHTHTNAAGGGTLVGASALSDYATAFVGPATTHTFTNKTYDTAGAGNSFLINGLAVTASTGTGSMARAVSPAFTTPSLGAATATSINGLTLTASTGVLTITNGKTVSVSNTLTFTGTDASSIAFGTGGTVAYTANNLSVFAATTSAQLAGVINDETGSGALVFGTAPTFTTNITAPIVYGGNANGSTHSIFGTSSATPAAAHVLINTQSAGTAIGSVLIGATAAEIFSNDLLHLRGPDAINALIVTDAYGVASAGVVPGFLGRSARGTFAAPVAVTTGDSLMFLGARGYQSGGAFTTVSNANISLSAAEAFTATNQATYISMGVTPTGTSITRAEVLRLSSTTTTGGTANLSGTGGGVYSITDSSAGTPTYFGGTSITGLFSVNRHPITAAFSDANKCAAGLLITVNNGSSTIDFSTAILNATTPIVRMTITGPGNVKIAGTAGRGTTEGTNHLDIFDGTAPVGTLTNGISLYSTAGELRCMDALGNPTLLSPHDKNGNWIFDSTVGKVNGEPGKRLIVDMEKLIKFLNAHFELDFVHEYEVEL
jgi:hypothetical protein